MTDESSSLMRTQRIRGADGTVKTFVVAPTKGDDKRAKIAARRVDPDIRDRLLPAADE